MAQFVIKDDDGKIDFGQTMTEVEKAIGGRASDTELKAIASDLVELRKQFEEGSESQGDIQKQLDEIKLKQAEAERKGDPVLDFPEWEAVDGGFERKFLYGSRLPREVRKSILTNDQTPGARVDTVTPYFDVSQADPFASVITRMQVNGDSMKVPALGDVNFAKESSIPMQGQSLNRTNQGSVSSVTETIDTYTLQILVSEPAADDVDGLDAVIMSEIMDRAGYSMAKETADAIKTDVANATPSITVVSDGDADAAPTPALLDTALESMLANHSVAYRPMSRLFVSPKIESVMRRIQATGADYTWDRRTGVDIFNNYPITTTDYLDPSTAAGQCGAVLANFAKLILRGDREVLTVRRYDNTVPGAFVYFARYRCKSIVWQPKAGVALKSKD